MSLKSQRVTDLPETYNVNDINSEDELLNTINVITLNLKAVKSDIKQIADDLESLSSRVSALENA